MNSRHIEIISSNLGITKVQIQNTIELLEQGSTIPFISRYRKEKTGSLDEVQIASIDQQWRKLSELEKRRETILSSIEEQGKLTDALKAKLCGTYILSELEDLYLPYKPKRKTRASVARENGLEPLADIIMKNGEDKIIELAKQFISDKVITADDALAGACDIIAERISEDIKTRELVRSIFSKEAGISVQVVKGKESDGEKYKDYFSFNELLSKCPSHRYLAISRGEDEEFLRISVEPDEEKTIGAVEKLYLKKGDQRNYLQSAISDSYKRLLRNSIETEFRQAAKKKADEEAIKVFGENLRELLLSPPLGQKNILAIDPGFRTGCKVVCLDSQGNLKHNETIYPHPPHSDIEKSSERIISLIKNFSVESIAIGNGTAGRETESFVRSLQLPSGIEIFMVNESGASIYSASAVARDELPDYDVTVRGAVSIGRRLMDPLAELVKIDPKSIGVGQYQHDVDQARLRENLDQTVESCVNGVGVNLNTASKQLLAYVSGLGPSLAEKIIEFRSKNGPFKSRKDLLKVPRMGDKAFEQSAGFLRVPGSANPLDNSAVHPESYQIVEQMAEDNNTDVITLLKKSEIRTGIDLKKYANETVGLPTLHDIMAELARPGRDPRPKAKVFSFDASVREINDLKPGMVLPGIVTNITRFGCFVDIGVHQDGLVHISQLADRYVSDPHEVVKLNQHVQVTVQEVDLERKRIQLSMKDLNN